MLGVTQGTVSCVHTVNVFYDHTVIISITYRIKASQIYNLSSSLRNNFTSLHISTISAIPAEIKGVNLSPLCFH